MDPVGGPFVEKITQSIRDSGTLIVYSAMGGLTATVGIPDLLYRDVRVRPPPHSRPRLVGIPTVSAQRLRKYVSHPGGVRFSFRPSLWPVSAAGEGFLAGAMARK